jgi:hypothetical protein
MFGRRTTEGRLARDQRKLKGFEPRSSDRSRKEVNSTSENRAKSEGDTGMQDHFNVPESPHLWEDHHRRSRGPSRAPAAAQSVIAKP